MTLAEFYRSVEGDYDKACENLLHENRILKYLLRFPASEDYAFFLSAFSDGDYDGAFRAVHNLKGISLTLGLSRLAEISSVLCKALRHGAPASDLGEERKKLDEEYLRVIGQIRKLA